MLPPATKTGAASATAIQPRPASPSAILACHQHHDAEEGERQAGGAHGAEALHLQRQRQTVGDERRKGEAEGDEAGADMADGGEGERVRRHAGEQAGAEEIEERAPRKRRPLSVAGGEHEENRAGARQRPEQEGKRMPAGVRRRLGERGEDAEQRADGDEQDERSLAPGGDARRRAGNKGGHDPASEKEWAAWPPPASLILSWHQVS